jgi:hypothetical protein
VILPIQATIVGYGNKACSLFSAYDEATQVLVISREAEYRRARRDGCLVLTNDLNIERDGLFTEDDFHEAINAYFGMKSGVAADGVSSRLVIDEKAARANPSNAIEKDGMDAGGQKYRVSESIACAQVAALATCLHVFGRVKTVNDMLDMADKLLGLDGEVARMSYIERFRRGEAFTI